MTIPDPLDCHDSLRTQRMHAPSPPDVDPISPPKPEIDPNAPPPEYDPDGDIPIIPPEQDPPSHPPPVAAQRIGEFVVGRRRAPFSPFAQASNRG